MRSGIPIVLTLFIALLAAGAANAGDDLEFRWSATIQGVVKDIDSNEDDDVTGFFDKYEFTPNKDSSFPFELGVSEFSLDLFRAEHTPLIQFRLRSPTSNLGLSGEDIDEPFLNQRAELYARPTGFQIDLGYRRMRTDELRLFPGASGLPGFPTPSPGATCAGCEIASWYNDDTGRNDRFYSKRTLFEGEVRFRPGAFLESDQSALPGLLPEVAVRGGYEDWSGNRQFRFMASSSDRTGGSTNDFVRWRGITQDIDQSVADVGGGLVLTPGGLFTLTLDGDYQSFRNHESPLLQTALQTNSEWIDTGGTKALRTINFIPETDRFSATARIHARIGERAVVHGGFQFSKLEQVNTKTPNQSLATPQLNENEVLHYSANLASDVRISQTFSLDTFFTFNLRNNKLDRGTSLFNPTNGSQVDEFIDSFWRITSGAELSYRPYPGQRYALGYRNEWIDRDLDFAQSGTLDHVLPGNAVLDEDTERHTVYVLARLRPVSGLHLSGEAGYVNAPETGYIRELDDVAYFKARGSYTLPISRPVTFSLFGRGEFGDNDDFKQVSETAGFGNPDRDFDRDNFAVGLNLTSSPWDRITLFTSTFYHHDAQDFDLVRSNRRKFEEPRPDPGDDVNYYTDSPLDYRAKLLNLLVGGSVRLGEDTDATVSYSYTRSDTKFRSQNATSGLLQAPSKIRSDIHSLDFSIGHWLRPGLRLSTGYRYDKYRDRTARPTGVGSVVSPFGLTSDRHTMLVSVTLTSELLESH